MGGTASSTLTFTPGAAIIGTIPTIGEWAMILFGVALAGGAVVLIQRRRLPA